MSAPKCPRCNKGCYPTVDDVIHVILNRLRRGAKPLRYYPCPHYSNTFHITKRRSK